MLRQAVKVAGSVVLLGSAAGARIARCEDVEGRSGGLDVRSEAVLVSEVALTRVSRMIAKLSERAGLAAFIDHTLLKPEVTPEQIRQLCEEAVKHGFRTVCVNGVNVSLAADCLRSAPEHNVGICAVVGFPLGASATEVKAFEAQQAIMDGAQEIDMVVNIGRAKSGDWEFVLRDIGAVVAVCKRLNAKCKVIIETSLLSDAEKIAASEACALAGADFVKTSTGFSTGGGTKEDVALMKKAVMGAPSKFSPFAQAGSQVKVKASGGIKSSADAVEMIRHGASRLGTSQGVSIVREAH